MANILLLFAAVTRCLVYALDILLLARVLLSWFPDVGDGAIGDFVFYITEPLVGFVRSIIFRFRFFRESPIDFSVFFSCVLCGILLTFL